ncbi:hypothetical protein PG988_001194 [Apiospora saccharicola]
MTKKWNHDTSFADIMEFLSPSTTDTTMQVAFEYEPDLHGRMFDAKVRQALPSLPGQAPRWGTWLEFFGGKILHAFCRHRGALLSGNEDSGKWLNQENWSTFYLVNNSDTTTFFDDQKCYCFLAKGKAYKVQGEDQPPLDRIRQAALEEEFGPTSEWPKKGIKPRLACRLLMMWPTRELASHRRNHQFMPITNLEWKRRWLKYPEGRLPEFPADM